MKKLSSMLALGLILALMMGMTVSASGSTSPKPSEPDTYKDLVSKVTGTNANVTLEAVTSTQLSNANGAIVSQINAAAGVLPSGQTLTANSAPVLRGAVDVKVDTVIPDGGLKLTFSVSNVASNRTYVALHLKSDNTWEVLPVTAGNGTLTVTFTSLSPVFFYEVSTTNSTASTSPKTGDAIPLAGVVAVICLAGAAICTKKVRFGR